MYLSKSNNHVKVFSYELLEKNIFGISHKLPTGVDKIESYKIILKAY